MNELITKSMLEDLTFTQQQNLALCIAKLAESKKDFSEVPDIIDFFFQLVSSANLKDQMIELFSLEMEDLQKNKNIDFEEIDNQAKEIFDSLICDTVQSMQLLRILTVKKYNYFSELILKLFFKNKYSKSSKTQNTKLFEQLTNNSQINELSKILNLNEIEKSVLNIAYTFCSSQPGSLLLQTLAEYVGVRQVYAICLSESSAILRRSISPRSKLVISNILDKEYFLTEIAYKSLTTGNYNNLFSNYLIPSEKSNYKLSDFNVNQTQTDFLLKLIKSNNACNIAIYGNNSYTKLQFANTLIKSSQNTSFLYSANQSNTNDDEDDDDDDYYSPTQSIYTKLKTILTSCNNNYLIINNSDLLFTSPRRSFFHNRTALNESKLKKAKELLNIVQKPTIWIFDNINEIDKKVLEDFTFSIDAGPITPAIKKILIHSEVNKYKDFFTKNNYKKVKKHIITTFEKEDFSTEKMQKILQTITSINQNTKDEKAIINDFDLIINNNSNLLPKNTKMREKVKPTYDLSVLNTSIDATQIVKMVKNAFSKSQNSNLLPSEKGIRLLFYGLSGTGKTELARYIAQELDKSIALYRASDIMDKYVGENEKAIKNAFLNAEKSKDILLFDEADSFFYDRQGASHSWERSLVNEFLTQMEEFSGILICTTNLKQIMDPAMNRRFHIITEFKALTNDGINLLLKKFFSDYTFSDNQISTLSKHNSITPGDFNTLYSKLRFCDDNFSSQNIVEELCKIQEEKNGITRKVGFM